MTPYTASLLYRCLIHNAASYTLFVVETNDITLKLWQGDYKTGDIKQWARNRIKNILTKAEKLWPLFADDAQLVESVQDAVRLSLENLDQAGLSGIVPIQNVRGKGLDK